MPVVVAGRSLPAAQEAAATLGPLATAAAVDGRSAAVADALGGMTVLVHCAGPFTETSLDVVRACLARGCHYVDIADDRRYVSRVRGLEPEIAAAGVCAVAGCSSLPGISTALATTAAAGEPSPAQVTVALFIGNDNPKGAASVDSLVRALGRPFAAPGGVTRRVFHRRTTVDLPPPFGRRPVFDLETPDLDLLPERLGVHAVEVKAGFELGLANALFAALASLSRNGYGPGVSRGLARIGSVLPRFGSSGGTVLVDVRWRDGRGRRAWIHADRDGQRMAFLPAAFVAERLASEGAGAVGVRMADEVLGAKGLLAALQGEGLQWGTA